MSDYICPIGSVVILLLALLWLWARRRAAEQARQSRPSPRPTPPDALLEPSSPAWRPPHYAATPAAAPEGPSLTVNINILQAQAENLLVSWTAMIDGSVPVAVQWGAPNVQLDEGGLLFLHYACYPAAAALFQAPETRVFQPGEILSRSASVARSDIGQDFAGLRVAVALGYGAADEHAAASALADAYQAWQRIAVSPRRIVPRG